MAASDVFGISRHTVHNLVETERGTGDPHHSHISERKSKLLLDLLELICAGTTEKKDRSTLVLVLPQIWDR